MPIVVRTDVREMSEEVFKEAAYAVTGAAFDIHNRFGNQFGERVYKCELAKECLQLGFQRAEVEVPVDVTFESFHKPFFLDLLVNSGALFELKAEAALSPAHQAQTLNYLFLTGLHFFGGIEQVVRAIPVVVDGQLLTTQPAHTLDPCTAFKLTGTDDVEAMEDALRRFLHHTELAAIQWVNLHNHDVTFITLLDLQ
jgi:GxxExxY protein